MGDLGDLYVMVREVCFLASSAALYPSKSSRDM